MEPWWQRLQAVSPELFYSRDPVADPRLGDIVPRFDSKKHQLTDFRYALIGFPEDRGVSLNQGRAGAALGPQEIRRAFYRLMTQDTAHRSDLRECRLIDLGDITPTETLEERQTYLGDVVRACLGSQIFPIVLGGGHETAYGHYQGYVGRIPHLLNIDAHLDVRPLEKGRGHSGSPFRQMMEGETPLAGSRLTTFGLQGSCNAERDLRYAQGKGVQFVWLEEILRDGVSKAITRVLTEDQAPLYATFCLDAIRGCEFPATSAAPAEGLTVREALQIVETLAGHPPLSSLDLVEYSPPLDPTGVCAKIAALLLYRFLERRIRPELHP